MAIKIIFHFLVIIILGIVQAALISALPGAWAGLQVVLVALFLLLGLRRWDLGFIYAFFAGILLDTVSLAPFGLYTVSFVAANAVAWLSLEKMITNRSLYAYLLLSLIGNVAFKAVFFGLWEAGIWIVSSDYHLDFSRNFWQLELKSLLMNLILVYAVFYISSFISKRYQPVFLSGTERYGKI